MTRNIFKGTRANEASFNKDKACIMLKDRLVLRQITVGKKFSSGDSLPPQPLLRTCGNGYLGKTPSAYNMKVTLLKDNFSF